MPASSAVTLFTEMTDPVLGPAGVVHVTLRIGPPTATHVKLMAAPRGTPMDGLAKMFTINGATVIYKRRGVDREKKEGGEG